MIDERRYHDWLGLFAEQCTYWVPLEERQASGHDTVSIIFDDRKLLETRVRRFSHPMTHAQIPHSRTVHMVSNVRLAGATTTGDIVARSNQIVVEFRNNKQILYAGHCEHHLIRAVGAFKIRLKRFDLVDSEGEHYGLSILL